MITKDHLLNSLLRECTICLHLIDKVRPEHLSYRPTPGQRSIEELLRYMSYCVVSALDGMSTGDWKGFAACRERANARPVTELRTMMEEQLDGIRAFFAAAGEEAMVSQEVKVPGGGTLPLAAAIMDGPLKWITAYKMQLFLYLKSAGVENLGTTNVWGGFDKPASA